MTRGILRLLAVLFAFGLVAAACGDSDESGGTEAGASTTAAGGDETTETTAAGGDETTETTAAGETTAVTEGGDDGVTPEGDPIVLGAVIPLSGPQASVGEFSQLGAELALEQVNAAGGVLGRPLEIEYKDSMAVAEEVVAKVRELDEEGVDLTMGFVTSAGCLAVAPIGEQLGMIIMSFACVTNKSTYEDFTDNFFRVNLNAEMLTRATAKAVQQAEPDTVKWVSISPDYEYGRNAFAVFENEMRNEVPGFEMVDEAWPPFQSPSYNDYITQVADDDAQGVLSFLYAGDMLNMLKQQGPFGLLEGKVFATQGMDLDVLDPMAASGDLPEVWNGIGYHADAFDSPTNDAFVAAYEEKYGVRPTYYPVLGYLGVLAYTAAIEKAGSIEVDAVKAALEGLEFDSPMGMVTIRPEDHQAVFEGVAVIKVLPTDDGGYEVAETIVVPGADVTSPPSPGEQNPFDVDR